MDEFYNQDMNNTESKNKKKFLLFLVITFVLFIALWVVLIVCFTHEEGVENPALNQLVNEGYLTNINEIHIEIPNINDTYTYCVWNDIHYWDNENDPEIFEDQIENVKSRRTELFLNPNQIESRDVFSNVISKVDEMQVDGLILNADIMDQITVDNLEFLKENMSKLQTPYMYLQSDHDILHTWTSFDKTKIKALKKEMNLNQQIYVMEQNEFLIIGINKSYKSIKKSTLTRIKKEFAKGKPIIIVTHVPYDSKVDSEFAAQVEMNRGRKLIWGEDDEYQPDNNMQELLNMIYAEDTPVKAVIAAHLHSAYTVSLTDQVTQYVLAPGYEGNITLVTIGSEK